MPVVIVNGNEKLETYALLDGGATCSALMSPLADKLGIDVHEKNMTVTTFGSKAT